MPKELAHWILAGQAYAGLDSGCPLKGIIEDHFELYLAGAVLPDTLLHLFSGPDSTTSLALAKRFHDTDGNSYTPFIQAEEHFQGGFPPGLLACLLGILAHMQADIVFHPFVYSISGVTDIGRHYRVETAIDVYFIRKIAAPPARLLRDLAKPHIWDDLVTACSMIFDPSGELPCKAIEQALSLHCRFQRMYCQTFWKTLARILSFLHVPLLKDNQYLFYPLNMDKDDGIITGREQWRHPVTGEPRGGSIEDMAGQAVQRTTAIIKRIAESGSLTKALTDPPGENLLTGMYGVKACEMAVDQVKGKRS